MFFVKTKKRGGEMHKNIMVIYRGSYNGSSTPYTGKRQKWYQVYCSDCEKEGRDVLVAEAGSKERADTLMNKHIDDPEFTYLLNK